MHLYDQAANTFYICFRIDLASNGEVCTWAARPAFGQCPRKGT